MFCLSNGRHAKPSSSAASFGSARRRFANAAILFSLALVPLSAHAQKKSGVGTVGAAQMAGGDGRFGVTYSLTDGEFLINGALVRAEYSVSRFNIDKGTTIIPKAGEKLLILHWQLKNPNPSDEYLSGNLIKFATVAKDEQTRDSTDYQRLASAKESIGQMLKPGQRLPEDLLAPAVVPADGNVPKLIVKLGRKGTSEKVTRFNLGVAPNIVKPLPPDAADPDDKSGDTARSLVAAKIGTVYPLGNFDWNVSSISFVPGPIGGSGPGDGKRYLVVSVSLTNKTWHPVYTYFQYILPSTLVTSDDETTKEYTFFKGKRDEPAEEKMLDPDETLNLRMAFVVPNDTTGKKLTMAEGVDNSGGKTRALEFDLTGVK